jgi:hypothetical protein
MKEAREHSFCMTLQEGIMCFTVALRVCSYVGDGVS